MSAYYAIRYTPIILITPCVKRNAPKHIYYIKYLPLSVVAEPLNPFHIKQKYTCTITNITFIKPQTTKTTKNQLFKQQKVM